ncbi:MAG: hypothetical protein HUJ59_00455 [Bacilli bacterium]|nr:hypothetical protein [Bacilli bacterium]
MLEEIEIKRKVFKVVSPLGKKTRIVERKGQQYFLKDFGNETKQFEDYIEGYNTLKVSGITVPKVYMYDKSRNIVISEYIPGKTVIEDLVDHDLKERYFEEAFNFNYYARKGKFSIDFDPKNFKLLKGKMTYLPMTIDKFNDKWSFEKNHIVIWFYSRELVKYLKNNVMEVDADRANNKSQAEMNKQIALMVVKYYK